MDQVDLPLLQSYNTPEDAIMQMNQFDRRFVIAEIGVRGYHSFSNKEVLQAWRESVPTLGAMNTGEPVVRIPIEQTVDEIMSIPWDHTRRKAAEQMMAQYDPRRFGLPVNLVVTGGLIRVLTQHESVRDEATSATKDCVCKNCSFSSACPPANSFNPCSNCSRNTWRCA